MLGLHLQRYKWFMDLGTNRVMKKTRFKPTIEVVFQEKCGNFIASYVYVYDFNLKMVYSVTH